MFLLIETGSWSVISVCHCAGLNYIHNTGLPFWQSICYFYICYHILTGNSNSSLWDTPWLFIYQSWFKFGYRLDIKINRWLLTADWRCFFPTMACGDHKTRRRVLPHWNLIKTLQNDCDTPTTKPLLSLIPTRGLHCKAVNLILHMFNRSTMVCRVTQPWVCNVWGHSAAW